MNESIQALLASDNWVEQNERVLQTRRYISEVALQICGQNRPHYTELSVIIPGCV